VVRYSGRDFTDEEIQWIKDTIDQNPQLNRCNLSRLFCERFNWRKPDGGLKDMRCRVVHLQMEKDGLIELPKARQGLNPMRRIQRTLLAEPGAAITVGAGSLDLEIEIVTKTWSSLWNEFIDRYHYLGYTRLAGAQLRYFVRHRGTVIALLGFSAAAWKTQPRDHYIGWNASQRERNLHLIVNNARFLILPWVQSRNLGSYILSRIAKRIGDDWFNRYNYRPVLLETFVDKSRFQGTCYKAANWVYTGDTLGRGKWDVKNEYNEPVKSVWLYPLIRSFRRYLCMEESSE
jgi:hypothetical protein